MPVRNDGDDGDGDAEGVVSRANAKNHAKMASLIPSFSQLSLKSYTQNPNPDDDDDDDDGEVVLELVELVEVAPEVQGLDGASTTASGTM